MIAQRWAERDGTAVRWGNMIGHLYEQTGRFTFEDESQAESFAVYAHTRGRYGIGQTREGVPVPVEGRA